MANRVNIKEYSDPFASDVSKRVISKGECFDHEAITQSIEAILATMFGERLFNFTFGSPLGTRLFSTINDSSGKQMVDDILSAIKKWENRITVIKNMVVLDVYPNTSEISISIPYVIKSTGVYGKFQKRIAN